MDIFYLSSGPKFGEYHKLKNLSDEAVVEEWQEQHYWQYFCGEIEVQHKPPCVANELSAFRKRIGSSSLKSLIYLNKLVKHKK